MISLLVQETCENNRSFDEHAYYLANVHKYDLILCPRLLISIQITYYTQLAVEDLVPKDHAQRSSCDLAFTAKGRRRRLPQEPPTYGESEDAVQFMEEYIDEAAEILTTLEPEYDGAATLKMVRGLADNNVKQAMAMVMYDKEWRFEEVERILRASVR
ncbi:uncharacterized protein DFL_009275 [Arthrobotrys flagrans]|uniref:Uncharacterized protein n=1 Tax=Arthrobotrys flagrans TaxID=97331 RepID=A0A436ZR68_ARTFL|nr:hypothetical protein DFL_009275 [Arthrobotrys flagrans]